MKNGDFPKQTDNWRFPKVGVPPVIIRPNGISHEINHPAMHLRQMAEPRERFHDRQHPQLRSSQVVAVTQSGDGISRTPMEYAVVRYFIMGI